MFIIKKHPLQKGTGNLFATLLVSRTSQYALIITVRVSVGAYCYFRATLMSPFTENSPAAFHLLRLSVSFLF